LPWKRLAQRDPKFVFADQHTVVTPVRETRQERQHTNFLSSYQGWAKHGRPNLELEAGGPVQEKNLATALQAWDKLQAIFPEYRRKCSEGRTEETRETTHPFHGPLGSHRQLTRNPVRQRP
jgi:hypothetical protein